ncbi:hypothetical protein [Marinifilum fragile]|uniref:hypothetical protein n=1 Tax=Marinifilum fragile TaxID=570161 RepID=UPI002AAB70DC|nr:hypothetical protein [Marinifilum fragile]
MLKVRIFVKNENVYKDDNVFIDVQLPSVPRKGETIFLSEESYAELESKAKGNLEIAKRYAPKWFYGESFSVETPTEKDLDNLSFGDMMYVCDVFYIANNEIVNVIMDDKREVDYV